jgi:hypothetical protein
MFVPRSDLELAVVWRSAFGNEAFPELKALVGRIEQIQLL